MILFNIWIISVLLSLLLNIIIPIPYSIEDRKFPFPLSHSVMPSLFPPLYTPPSFPWLWWNRNSVSTVAKLEFSAREKIISMASENRSILPLRRYPYDLPTLLTTTYYVLALATNTLRTTTYCCYGTITATSGIIAYRCVVTVIFTITITITTTSIITVIIVALLLLLSLVLPRALLLLLSLRCHCYFH